MFDRKRLRQQIRQQRRQLTDSEQKHAAQQWHRQAHRFSRLTFCRRVAVYLAFDGEISLQPWIEQAWRRGQSIYLPVLHPLRRHQVWFVEFKSTTVLRPNRFGILEPDLRHSRAVPAWSLNAICLPLVAFDTYGNRIGMGGGFYDRLLDGLRRRQQSVTTIGCAHQLQQIDLLPTESWDQPIDYVLTDQTTITSAKGFENFSSPENSS